MGERDIADTKASEKQIHLAAFELPKWDDYLDIATRSLSPLVKVVIVFVGVTLLSGCEKKPEPVSQTATPPSTIKVNTKGSSTHRYRISRGGPYALGLTDGSPINVPPSAQFPEGVQGNAYLWRVEIEFPSGTAECPNYVRQTMRDTVTYVDGTVLKDPPAQGTNPGGHEATSGWAFDPEPDGRNSGTQQNGNGTGSYIDAPGVVITDPRSQLPVTKRTTYRWELVDCNNRVLDCRQSEYVLDIDANGVVTKKDYSALVKCP